MYVFTTCKTTITEDTERIHTSVKYETILPAKCFCFALLNVLCIHTVWQWATTFAYYLRFKRNCGLKSSLILKAK